MTLHTDLPESDRDKRELQQEEIIMDLPDVEDIPGQEHIHVPGLGELADTTISSDDEEGAGIFDELEDIDDGTENEPDGDDDITDDSVSDDSDVTEDEKIALERTATDMDTPDNEGLYTAELDDEDFDGEKLNEDIEVTADDLDIPGAELDDADEEIGEEDEENNDYSEADTK
ncbi:MAG: hypothetical protein ABI405_04860 [Parafilimonas sp.]